MAEEDEQVTTRELKVTIRKEDWTLLGEIAADQRREPRQQAEAFLDQVLAKERASANGVGKPHVNGARRGARIPVAPTG